MLFLLSSFFFCRHYADIIYASTLRRRCCYDDISLMATSEFIFRLFTPFTTFYWRLYFLRHFAFTPLFRVRR